MRWLALCFLGIVLALQGSLVGSQGGSQCALRDAPAQCGSFCLSALHPLFDDTDNIRSRLDGIEAKQEVLKDLKRGLQGVHTKLESCKIQAPEDYEARINGTAEQLRALKIVADAYDELKSRVHALEESIAIMREELLTVKNELLRNRDEQISDLRSQVKSMETTLAERSTQLAECLKADDNLPDSCPSGTPNGIYQLKLRGLEPFQVPCVSSPSGWTVVQRRLDGSENFARNWEDYKEGFGNIKGEFFIGLEKLHRLTEARPHELYIKLGKINGSTSYAHYDDFKIGSENELYELKSLGKYSGEAGDSFKYHENRKFTTFDRDNDESVKNCAADEEGGWWYNQCGKSSLNGKYYKDGQLPDGQKLNGINWGTWHGFDWKQSLTYVEMMIRPKSL